MSIDYAAYPHIPLEQLRMLWIHDYYDGPLSGMLLFKGRMCWYELCARGGEDRDKPNVWRYVIRELTDAQIQEEQHWQALFVEHVGAHWTIHEDGGRGSVKPMSEHAKFYEPYGHRTPVDYSHARIVGWFEQ